VETRRHLTLGAIHSALRDRLGEFGWARVVIRFEQRSAVAPSAEHESRDPELFLVRTFEARLDYNDAELERADLVAAGMSQQPSASIHVVRRPYGEYLYSVDGLRFGLFERTPDLFDVRRFESTLEAVAVADATLEEAPRDSGTVLVLDADVDIESFRTLLDVFSADVDEDSLDLRSYSVAITAGDALSLDYWWSLAGNEHDGDAEYRHTVACHVEISLASLSEVESAGDVEAAADLPVLEHIDDVWALARSERDRRREESEAAM